MLVDDEQEEFKGFQDSAALQQTIPLTVGQPQQQAAFDDSIQDIIGKIEGNSEVDPEGRLQKLDPENLVKTNGAKTRQARNTRQNKKTELLQFREDSVEEKEIQQSRRVTTRKG